MAGLAIMLAVSGVVLLRRKSIDQRSLRIVPPALDRVEVALPPGSRLLVKATIITPNNYKTAGRIVFASALPGAEARASLSARLGWPPCGEAVLQSFPCGSAPGPEDLLAGVQSAVKTGSSRDLATSLLGDQVAEADGLPVGTVIVQVLVNAA